MKTMTFGQLGELFDGPHATPVRREHGPYFLNIASLNAGRLDLTLSDHVSEDDFVKWTRRVIPSEGDLLFSYETRLGEAALMPDGVRACLGRRMALLRPDRGVVDPQFLLYFYLSPACRALIATHQVPGATVPRIHLSTMPKWQVRIPGLGQQIAVAEVLRALDDKIAANRAGALVALDLALSLAARSSDTVLLSEIARLSRKVVQPAQLGANCWHYSLPSFDESGLPENDASDSIMSSKYLIDGECVLVSKLNPRIPRVWAVSSVTGLPGVASTEFQPIVGRGLSSGVLWSLLAQPQFSASLATQVAGTSGSHQRVSPDDIMKTQVLDPRGIPSEVQNQIESLVTWATMQRHESRTLAELRDTLLPALMSGQLTVRDAERQVEGVL